MRRGTAHDDEPFSGRPLRTAIEADPAKVAPDVRPQDLHLLTGCGRFNQPGSGDALPPRAREGSQQAVQHASRRGDRLYFPDGRVTDLAGNPTTDPTVQRCSLPLSVSNSSRWDRLNGRD